MPTSSNPRVGDPAAAPAPAAAEPPRPKQSAPPLATIERRLKRELSRGRGAIDAALDLHGLTQAEAHQALRGFLRHSQARGARLVIVVTGKGGPLDETGSWPSERGVLRRLAPHWLREPDLRSVVLGFEEAGRAHGGSGALYVRLQTAPGPGSGVGKPGKHNQRFWKQNPRVSGSEIKAHGRRIQGNGFRRTSLFNELPSILARCPLRRPEPTSRPSSGRAPTTDRLGPAAPEQATTFGRPADCDPARVTSLIIRKRIARFPIFAKKMSTENVEENGKMATQAYLNFSLAIGEICKCQSVTGVTGVGCRTHRCRVSHRCRCSRV